ncbi:bidirectional sugar transporter SWEET7-like [Chenopodium quinoa]|uniref:Bidirectional sugar transporter SWEET n=1 Tax=Chenopodium quinoa TaxID=63459 RepID=A0A803L578_CHEQI|nr:bidirectional sugar transporter SWEET7-like [Chenopodium quinoa]
MVSPAVARFAVGILGNIISFSLYLSPMPTFIRICKKGSVEQYSATPYLLTFLNCMLWTIYGMPFIQPNNILLSTISASGCLIESIYLMLFIINTENKKKKIILIILVLGEILAVGIALALVLTFMHTSKDRTRIFGLLGDVSGVLMYASPLAVMKQVVKTKSVEYMPLAVSVTCFGSAVIWTLYAIRPFDPYVVAPNAIGCFLGLAQLILYAAYYKSTKQQMAAKEVAEEKVEMGLKEIIVVTKGPNKVNNLPENDYPTLQENDHPTLPENDCVILKQKENDFDTNI